MQTDGGLPTPDAIKKLLYALLNAAITCEPETNPSPAPSDYVAVYEGDDGQLEAYLALDRNLVVHSGGALTMVALVEVEAALKTQEIPMEILDGFKEVANILAQVFNYGGRPHVKLRGTHLFDEVPPDVLELLSSQGERLHLKVSIGVYGEGVLSVFARELKAKAAPLESALEDVASSAPAPAMERREPVGSASSKPPSRSWASTHGAPVPAAMDDGGHRHTAAPTLPDPLDEGPVTVGHLRVLVVEDDPMMRMLLRSLLLLGNHQTLEAPTASEALRLLSTAKVDLILLDVRLPDMSGVELARRLKAELFTAKTPVIMCSAVADREVVAQAAALKVAGYLLKPITAEKLYNKLMELGPRMVPALEPPKDVARRMGLTLLDYRRLLSVFLDESPSLVQGLYGAEKMSDFKRFDFLIHRLCASAGQIGARAIVDAATASLEVARGGDSTVTEKHLLNLELELKRLGDAIHDHFSLRNTFRHLEEQALMR